MERLVETKLQKAKTFFTTEQIQKASRIDAPPPRPTKETRHGTKQSKWIGGNQAMRSSCVPNFPMKSGEL